MDYELPTEFDLIVVGTGMVESIIAAAGSRIGKRILHLDKNDYYGGLWASFNLDTIHKLSSQNIPTNSAANDIDKFLNTSETNQILQNNYFSVKDIDQKWHIPEVKEKIVIENENSNEEEVSLPNEDPETNDITQESLCKQSRKFNIDISPKLQFSRGDFVELLISSNIARYSEFRCVSRVLTLLHNQLEVVPCSRSDVFSNTKVTVIEKRMLMKLLTTILDGNESEFQGYSSKTFHSYLKDKKLTANLIHYVLYALAMSNETTPFPEGVQNMKRFLNSLGRYGKTPLLYSMYGSGEMPQAFCRMSAVFGGIYALNQTVHSMVLNPENVCTGLVSGEQRLTAPCYVMAAEYIPASYIQEQQRFTYISHGVFITDKSMLLSEKENLTLLLYPPAGTEHAACIVIEMGSATGTCPNDYYIVHLVTKQQKNPKDDLQHCVDRLFECDDAPNIFWSLYYSIPDSNNVQLQKDLPKNVYMCPGPDIDLDFDASVAKAKEIFASIYPEEEFLPRAPDPEEIIIGEDESDDADKAGFAADIREELGEEIAKSHETEQPIAVECGDVIEDVLT